MKDTITKGTHNSRSILGAQDIPESWPEALAMLKSTGWPIDLGPLNPLGCLQIGTGYTKEEVLTDETAEFLGGVDTPNEALNVLAGFKLVAQYKKAGAYTFNANSDVTDIIAIVISGGGAGGAVQGIRTNSSSRYYSAFGGNSGNIALVQRQNIGEKTYPVVVGAGGLGDEPKGTVRANNGGSSSFDGTAVLGGYGGHSYSDYQYSPGLNVGPDFQCSTTMNLSTYPNALFGGVGVNSSNYYTNLNAINLTAFIILTLLLGRYETHMAAGGLVYRTSGEGTTNGSAQLGNVFSDTGTSSPGGEISTTGAAAKPPKGTEPGCGGGASSGATGAIGGDGADGAVYIFVKKGVSA